MEFGYSRYTDRGRVVLLYGFYSSEFDSLDVIRCADTDKRSEQISFAISCGIAGISGTWSG